MNRIWIMYLLLSVSFLAMPLWAQEGQPFPDESVDSEENLEDTIKNFRAQMEREHKELLNENVNGQTAPKENVDVDKRLNREYQQSKPALPKPKDSFPPTMSEEKSKQISRFFEEAAKNYDEILNNRPYAEMDATQNRIKANKGLLSTNDAKLKQSQEELRKLKLEYIRRFLIIKNAYKRKRFSKEMYEKELEKLARQYEFRVRSLAGDVSFYEDEMSKTKSRLKELEEINRINKIMSYNTRPRQKKVQQKTSSELEKMMQRLQSMDAFEVRNLWKAPDIK